MVRRLDARQREPAARFGRVDPVAGVFAAGVAAGDDDGLRPECAQCGCGLLDGSGAVERSLVEPEQPGRFGAVRRQHGRAWQQLAQDRVAHVGTAERSAGGRAPDRIDHERHGSSAPKGIDARHHAVQVLHAAEHAGLDRLWRHVARQGGELCIEHVGGDRLDALHRHRVLRRDRGDGGAAVNLHRIEGAQIGLHAGAGATVGAGHAPDHGPRLFS